MGDTTLKTGGDDRQINSYREYYSDKKNPELENIWELTIAFLDFDQYTKWKLLVMLLVIVIICLDISL